MRELVTIAAAAAFICAPAQAADLQAGGAGEVRAGAFVGARVQLAMGGSVPAKPHAGLAVALTQSYRSASGRTVTRFGEGVALDLASGKPTLNVGGVSADAAFGLRQQGNVESKQRLGISTGALIGIGLVVVAVIAVTQFTCIGKDREFCGSD